MLSILDIVLLLWCCCFVAVVDAVIFFSKFEIALTFRGFIYTILPIQTQKLAAGWKATIQLILGTSAQLQPQALNALPNQNNHLEIDRSKEINRGLKALTSAQRHY